MASCNQKQAESVPAIDRSNFDESVALNEDFYQYATGGWQAKNPLKPEFARYGTFDVLRENNEIRLNDLFASMTKSKAEKGSVEQKIADLYTMGLDSVRRSTREERYRPDYGSWQHYRAGYRHRTYSHRSGQPLVRYVRKRRPARQ